MEILSVLKCEGDNSTFVWKHPKEDFNCFTQLIVHESQEAVFFMNGQAMDRFGPGHYTLETMNIPLISKILNRAVGDVSPFHCEVYFINKTVQMAVKWGTDSKVRYLDPEFGLPLELGASGEMNLQVSDGYTLLVKLVGTMSGIAWDDRNGFSQSLKSAFRPLISTAVKSNLAAAIKAGGYSIFEVDEHLTELSDTLRQAVLPGFEEYGLTIPQFYLTTVVLPEDDPNFKRIRELHTITLQTRTIQAEAAVKTAQAQSQAQYRTVEEQSKAAIEQARRQAELERQTTETEIARREAERKLITAQAEAEAAKLSGFAEAQVMAAKGYTQKDVLQTEVQKAYAEGLGQMGANGGGGGLGDIAQLGVALGAMGGVMGMAKEAVAPMFGGPQAPAAPAAPAAEGWTCTACGKAGITTNFCPDCGAKKPAAGWTCPQCGQTGITSNFCPDCGRKKEV